MSQGRVTYEVMTKVSPPAVVMSGQDEQVSGAVRLYRDVNAPTLDRRRSVRAFHIVPDGQAPAARVFTEQALGSRLSGRPAVYRVEDPLGVPLGRITLRRRRWLSFGRMLWTVEPSAGPVLRGYRGRLVWWALWWPFGLPVSLLCLVVSILGEGDGGFGSPRRIIWRDDSGRAHLVFRGMEADDFQVLVPGWDSRLITGLVALHQAFEPSQEAGSAGWYGR
ncbi:hypothetical protein ACFWWM_16805 [Streptomyces sp. NPDC058682]|uniref:hypothetical protein n=1 Tax=unclassified Streptomyces TaxID=2593676 RepID=UPI00225AED2A|nr:hypothetical protein [Streptomyces sp. NBC_01214]MCX4804438.1 hypothetical protein [Streptomyces sp. NBC_01214]